MRIYSIIYACFLFIVSCSAQQFPKEITDLIYYSGEEFNTEKHRLNLVLADVPDSPLLLWIHGGAWSGGDRKDEMPLARKFAEKGISVAVMSYRLSPAEFRNPPKKSGIQHPGHINDVANAFKWIYDHADEYSYSREKLFVSGFSAGAHLSALLVMDSKYLNVLNLSVENIKGCIPVSGAYDIPKYFEAIENAYDKEFAIQHVNGVFGSSDGFIEASPVSYIDQLKVPMLVQTDGALSLYADTFKKALLEKDREDVDFSYYSGFNHAELYKDLLHNDQSEARNEIVAFIHLHSNSGKTLSVK